MSLDTSQIESLADIHKDEPSDPHIKIPTLFAPVTPEDINNLNPSEYVIPEGETEDSDYMDENAILAFIADNFGEDEDTLVPFNIFRLKSADGPIIALEALSTKTIEGHPNQCLLYSFQLKGRYSGGTLESSVEVPETMVDQQLQTTFDGVKDYDFYVKIRKNYDGDYTDNKHIYALKIIGTVIKPKQEVFDRSTL